MCYSRDRKGQTKVERGKRETDSQRIGKRGEALFEAWAYNNDLNPQSASRDIGIDFYCDILRAAKNSAVKEASGSVLAVQVKSTGSSNVDRITISRVDAENLLRLTQSSCLVAVDVIAPRIFYLFLEEGLIKELGRFLSSAQPRLRIPFSAMKPAGLHSRCESFVAKLNRHRKPLVQHRLNLLKAQVRLRRADRGAYLAVDSESDNVAVFLPLLGSAFRVPDDQREAARVLAFEQLVLPSEIPGVELKPEIAEALEISDSLGMIGGPLSQPLILIVEDGEDSAPILLEVRKLDNEYAFIHPCGLIIVISEHDRKSSKRHSHQIHVRIGQDCKDLEAANDALPFLRLLNPGSRLIGPTGGLPVHHWGLELMQIGPAIRALERVTTKLGVDLRGIRLCDFTSTEFGTNVGVLDAILSEGVDLVQLCGGVIMAKEDEHIEDFRAESASANIPLLLDLGPHGIVVWFCQEPIVYIDSNEYIRGIQFSPTKHLTLEVTYNFNLNAGAEVRTFRPGPTIRFSESGPVCEFEMEEKDATCVHALIFPRN